MVHAAARFVLLFLIRILRDLTSSPSKLFEMLLVFNSDTGLSVPKTRTFEKFCKKYTLLSTLPNKSHCWTLQLHFKFKNYQTKDKFVHSGAPLVLLFLIVRLEDLTTSYSELFETLLFLINYTGLCVPKTKTFEKFGKN